jgi:hypothetical protein
LNKERKNKSCQTKNINILINVEETSQDTRHFIIESAVELDEDEINDCITSVDYDDPNFNGDDYKVSFKGTEYGDDSQVNISGDEVKDKQ